MFFQHDFKAIFVNDGMCVDVDIHDTVAKTLTLTS